MQSAFKPVMVLLPMVGGVSASMVNDVQAELFWKTFAELLSVAKWCDVMCVHPWNMEL